MTNDEPAFEREIPATALSVFIAEAPVAISIAIAFAIAGSAPAPLRPRLDTLRGDFGTPGDARYIAPPRCA